MPSYQCNRLPRT